MAKRWGNAKGAVCEEKRERRWQEEKKRTGLLVNSTGQSRRENLNIGHKLLKAGETVLFTFVSTH